MALPSPTDTPHASTKCVRLLPPCQGSLAAHRRTDAMRPAVYVDQQRQACMTTQYASFRYPLTPMTRHLAIATVHTPPLAMIIRQGNVDFSWLAVHAGLRGRGICGYFDSDTRNNRAFECRGFPRTRRAWPRDAARGQAHARDRVGPAGYEPAGLNPSQPSGPPHASKKALDAPRDGCDRRKEHGCQLHPVRPPLAPSAAPSPFR
jgi:hypothetical protein